MDPVTNATPAPSSQAPTTTSQAEPAGSPAPSGGDDLGFDVNHLVSDDVDDSGAGEPTPTAAPAQPPPASPPAAPQGQPSAGPPAVPDANAAAAAAPPAPPEPQAPPSAATGQPSATDAQPAAPELTIEQHRSKFLPQLEQLYQLNDADVEAIRTTPEKAFPNLAARLHYEVQMGVYQGILSILPQVIDGQMRGYTANQKNEDAFYGKWPALRDAVAKDPAASQAIVSAIQAYRQFNPKAPLTEVIERAGLMAMMHLKLPISLPSAGNGAGGPLAQPGVAPPLAAPQVPARPPGVGTTGHVPFPSASGTDEGEDLIKGIVEAHERGEA